MAAFGPAGVPIVASVKEVTIERASSAIEQPVAVALQAGLGAP